MGKCEAKGGPGGVFSNCNPSIGVVIDHSIIVIPENNESLIRLLFKVQLLITEVLNIITDADQLSDMLLIKTFQLDKISQIRRKLLHLKNGYFR